jgi:hypothetical protein
VVFDGAERYCVVLLTMNFESIEENLDFTLGFLLPADNNCSE